MLNAYASKNRRRLRSRSVPQESLPYPSGEASYGYRWRIPSAAKLNRLVQQ
ncbi:MAG: hypothetical protein V7K77_02795 [Nostoc sp.]|uniref:hypothetical protein n=1 Tax=Nostoc sp. TaxID=1180 RepID=UPI002FFC26F3